MGDREKLSFIGPYHESEDLLLLSHLVLMSPCPEVKKLTEVVATEKRGEIFVRPLVGTREEGAVRNVSGIPGIFVPLWAVLKGVSSQCYCHCHPLLPVRVCKTWKAVLLPKEKSVFLLLCKKSNLSTLSFSDLGLSERQRVSSKLIELLWELCWLKTLSVSKPMWWI